MTGFELKTGCVSRATGLEFCTKICENITKANKTSVIMREIMRIND
jgi:hypothetical protein